MQIFTKGAIGITEEDDPLEQAALALDVVKFHAAECLLPCRSLHLTLLTIHLVADVHFPRQQTMRGLLLVIKQQPKLAKEASSALVDIGQAIQSTVTSEELNVLIRGTLQQEVYVRTSCLQTLRVRQVVCCRLECAR